MTEHDQLQAARKRQALLEAARAYTRAWDLFQLDDTVDNESIVACMETTLYQLAGLEESAARDGDA